MAFYRLGSTGEEVRLIQEELSSLRLYLGPIDGAFGGGTAAAVRRFQEQEGLGRSSSTSWCRTVPSRRW